MSFPTVDWAPSPMTLAANVRQRHGHVSSRLNPLLFDRKLLTIGYSRCVVGSVRRHQTANRDLSCRRALVAGTRQSLTVRCLPPCAVIAIHGQQWHRWRTTPSLFPAQIVAGKFNAVYYWLKFDADRFACCWSAALDRSMHRTTCPFDIRRRSPSPTVQHSLFNSLGSVRPTPDVRRSTRFGLGGALSVGCHIWCVAAFAEPGKRIQRRRRRRWRHFSRYKGRWQTSDFYRLAWAAILRADRTCATC